MASRKSRFIRSTRIISCAAQLHVKTQSKNLILKMAKNEKKYINNNNDSLRI